MACLMLLASCSKDDDPVVIDPTHTDKTPDGLEAVDLGLPSGTRWANMNVGAKASHEPGLYFSWGDVNGHDGANIDWFFDISTDKHCNVTEEYPAILGYSKYQYPDEYNGSSTDTPRGRWYDENGNFVGDNKLTLDAQDDAAQQLWGGGWRMPTAVEAQELFDNCIWKYETVGGITGIRLTSKVNGKSIFLPAGGDIGKSHDPNDQSKSMRHWLNYQGYYWTSTLAAPNEIINQYPGATKNTGYACILFWSAKTDGYEVNGQIVEKSEEVTPRVVTSFRFGGRTIRAVYK